MKAVLLDAGQALPPVCVSAKFRHPAQGRTEACVRSCCATSLNPVDYKVAAQGI